MLNIKEINVLLQIIKRCSRIRSKTNDLCFENFCLDEDVKEIVCFNIFQIGELVNNFSETFVNNYNLIPWKNIKGMRNRIVHGYDTIKLNFVWYVAIYDIIELENYCIEILEKEKINI